MQPSTIEWTEVPGFPGYFVSRDGALRGRRGKTMRPMTSRDGHLYVIAYVQDRGVKLWAHRAVLAAFVGPCPPELECRHLDGDPSNNCVGNLAWGTRAENMRDKALHGRELRGEQKSSAKLTAEQARAIRADTRSARTIGAEYGISHTTVLTIRRGQK